MKLTDKQQEILDKVRGECDALYILKDGFCNVFKKGKHHAMYQTSEGSCTCAASKYERQCKHIKMLTRQHEGKPTPIKELKPAISNILSRISDKPLEFPDRLVLTHITFQNLANRDTLFVCEFKSPKFVIYFYA